MTDSANVTDLREVVANRVKAGKSLSVSDISMAESEARPVTRDLGDTSNRYVAAVHPIFTSLRNVASQMAALLILELTSRSLEVAGHPMLEVARFEFDGLADQLLTLSPTSRTAHFHQHLTASMRRVGESLKAANHLYREARTEETVDRALFHVRRGLNQLRLASEALPGFEMVDMTSACCACGAVNAGRARGHRLTWGALT